MTPLDKAITEYRENPTEENRQRLLALQAQSVNAFYGRNADEYIRRTK